MQFADRSDARLDDAAGAVAFSDAVAAERRQTGAKETSS
jgi:hypothetical protein